MNNQKKAAIELLNPSGISALARQNSVSFDSCSWFYDPKLKKYKCDVLRIFDNNSADDKPFSHLTRYFILVNIKMWGGR